MGNNILPYPTGGAQLDSTLCYNGIDSVFVQPKYSIFHTQNDLWDGPIDSNYCLNNAGASYIIPINFMDTDTSRYVFVEADIDTQDTVLVENSVYRFSIQSWDNSTVDTDCSDGSCSKLYLQVRKPHPSGTGDTVVVHELDIDVGWDAMTGSEMLVACFATEKFAASQILERFVIQLDYNPANGTQIDINQIYFEYGYEPAALLSNSNITTHWWGSNYALWNSGLETQYLAWHDQLGYPELGNTHYIDLIPQPNVATPQNVDIVLESQTHLMFQPFVEFRGGEVLGGGANHTYTLINNGSEVCLMPFLDIKILDGNAYKHSSGNIMFGNDRSCMMFDAGGKLLVAKDAKLSYGKKAVGLLGLHSDGEVYLGENATLELNNTVVMGDDFGENSEGVHVYMEPYSSLIFREGSELKDWSKNGTMRLLVHMNKSSVDVEALKLEERDLVVLIYDEFSEDDLGLIVYENPILSDAVHIQFEAQQNDQATISITDLNGNSVFHTKSDVLKGRNTEELELPKLGSGTYILRFSLAGLTIEEKLVKL
jgi:hypothetical protein